MCGESFIPTLVEMLWDDSEKNGKMFNILLSIWHTVNNAVLTKLRAQPLMTHYLGSNLGFPTY